jgi:uncharacterized protein (TIGR02145 family)
MKRILLTLALIVFTVPTVKAQDLPSYVPTDGLVAYYPFNGNASDESGNKNHGTVNGATLTFDRDGNENSAYYFNVNASGGWGSAQNRITVSSPTISNENSFTISAWINLETKPSPFDNRPHTIMGRWDGNGVAVFRHQINYSGEISTNLIAGTNFNIVEGGSVTYGEWYHIVIIYNGSILKQYINNQLTKQEQLDIDINTSSTDLTFGELHMANGHWYLFSGKMDDLGYWNRALTEQEIQNLYTSSSGDILLNGTVSVENNQIKNVADPTEAQDAVTKSYFDANKLLSPNKNIAQILLVGNDAYGKQLKGLADPTDVQDAVTLSVLLNKIETLQDQIDALQASSDSGTVTDQDGNSYPYLTYGAQVWTVKNAEVVTYRDGTPIPQVTDNTEWKNLTTGAWSYFNNDPTKPRLYNWYAVMGIHDTDPNTPNKEFAPEGWHVPSDAEWTTLENHLIANGYNYDGTLTENKIAKAMASTTGWISSTATGAVGNDQSLNNDSGFNAFPEGSRSNFGSFIYEGYDAIFWSSTEDDTNNAWNRYLNLNFSTLYRYYYASKQGGFSVRFVRD